jgi:Brp/Blh family beta-carotene 15,15'-monooxygenase
MSKIYNFSIILSFAGLWITSIFSGDLEIILGFILIFSFGILHGSNDILLIDSISNQKTRYPFIRVLTIYLTIVFSAVVIFYLIPLFALVLFILFSAFHFGEQHWEYRNLKVSEFLKNGLYSTYGLLVLQLLFVLNPEEVIEIVYSITGYALEKSTIWYAFITNVIVFAIISIYFFYKSLIFKSIILTEVFYLLIFSVIFKVSTLIWGFTIYFILWHSVPSLYEQITFIYGQFNKRNIQNYCKKALPYWIVSLLGISLVYIIFKDEKIFSAIFFSFLAAVTFPHALVINKMFSHKKTREN